ncbi:hypothetical protein Cni_G20874 [Canna indica]|uniref:Uncharacterized protein n=1 Tax=Canna indica TaxID=4628 RepID=A0AAQ3KPQ7_9LILI|nr:hypothetical protein Cni_G20874 [Canna indica]
MEAASELHPAPPKRPKTLAKGKEKMQPEPTSSPEDTPAASGMDEEEGEETCGICLSDSERSIRGRIDSCDHCFCFVCIMEWAKIESRCPLCKRRFQSIRRPPVRGVFPVERVVHVPVRDQVYHPLGNESTARSDPYAHVKCNICHGSQNEELLLLCDLCDLAAHTYCVGLGATVPEGDWYCPDCTILRDRHSKSESDDDFLPQDSCKNVGGFQLPEQLISISDIVADEIPSSSSRSFSNLNILGIERNPHRLQSINISCGRTQHSGTQTDLSSSIPTVGESFGNSANNIETGARTLRNCRNLHDRIQAFRSNWNDLRAGSLHFVSNLSAVNRTEKRLSAPAGTSYPQETTSHINQEETTSSSVSSKTNKKANSDDVNKAWEMLKIAKAQATQRNRKSGDNLSSICKKNIIKNTAYYPAMDNVCKGPEKLQSCLNVCNGKSVVGNKASSNRPEDQDVLFKMYGKHNYSVSKQTPYVDKLTDAQNFQGPHQKSQLLPKVSLCQTHMLPDFQESQGDPGSIASSQCCVSISLSNKRSNYGPSDLETNSKKVTVSGIDASLNLSKERAKRNYSNDFESSVKLSSNLPTTNGSADNSSKGEIQSLVKLNLSLLNRDQKLEAERYKKVARIATHSILAACGLEHSKSSARSFPNSICSHPEQIKQLRKSNLMPNSCRECFYAFVQNVVKSVLSEKNLIGSPPD